MISLEQIKTLDEKVKSAITVITSLRSENTTLKEKLDEYQLRIEELELLIEDFKNDQGAIEQGILDAISQLDTLEQSESKPVEYKPAEKHEKQPEPVLPQETSSADEAEPEAETEATEENTSPEPGAESAVPAVQNEPAMEASDDPDEQESKELDIF